MGNNGEKLLFVAPHVFWLMVVDKKKKTTKKKSCSEAEGVNNDFSLMLSLSLVWQHSLTISDNTFSIETTLGIK